MSITPRSVTSTSALRASSSSWRICETSTHSCASPVAPSLMPSGLSRTTSRPSSTVRPARWTSAANASSALVLRIPWEPMNAILAGRGHGAAAVVAADGPGLARHGAKRMPRAAPAGGTCAIPPGADAACGPRHRRIGALRACHRGSACAPGMNSWGLCAGRAPHARSTTPAGPKSAARPLPACVARTLVTTRPGNLARQARAATPDADATAMHRRPRSASDRGNRNGPGGDPPGPSRVREEPRRSATAPSPR